MGGKPDIYTIYILSKYLEEKELKKKHQKNARSAVLLIKREQQFGIFIYCNVILESFFISNGWFLNENVEEKTAFMLRTVPSLICVF